MTQAPPVVTKSKPKPIDSWPPDRAHPLTWVPTLYFAMGTPNIIVSVVAAIMYKNLGLTNTQIALYTGSMYLPWVIKPVWAPLLEMFRTKRFFVLATEFAMAALLACVGLALGLPNYLLTTIVLFWVIGFASATQDIAADGVYIAAMSPKRQAQYVGIQGIFWNAGRLLAAGVMIEFTQYLHEDRGMSWPATWTVVMLVLGGTMLLLGLWHSRALPAADPPTDGPKSVAEAMRTMGDTWLSFLRKEKLWLMLAVVFFYRFAEGFIEKIGPLFMLDSRATGGLGLDNQALGRINGTYATIGFLVGTVLGGLFAAKMSLRRSFWLLALALNVPHVTYFYLSHARPESIELIAAVVTIEKFGYGFGSVGHMLYMMQQVAPGPYRTAHYAFATGIMGLSMMLTGMISGTVQEALGYQDFFLFVLFASVPPVLLAWLAPFTQRVDADQPAPSAAH